MAEARIQQFKVETVWQELVYKRIQKIESFLEEIRFENQLNFLLAKGSIKREIIYRESDGRLKKTKDRIQFETLLGEALSEPIPLFKTELRQDYYLFQPDRTGEAQAFLEQGFSLIVHEMAREEPEVTVQTILTDKIVEKGNYCTIVKLPVKFSNHQDLPKHFEGKVNTFQFDGSVINGEIQGKIQYVAGNKSLLEMDLNQSFSLLFDRVLIGPQQKLLSEATITDVFWTPVFEEHHWLLELKLDCQWFLVESVELQCMTPFKKSAANLAGENSAFKIQSAIFIQEKSLDISKTLHLEFNAQLPDELKTHIIQIKEKTTPTGLLLEVILEHEAIYINESGIESYQKWEKAWEELLSGIHPEVLSEPLFVSRLNLRESKFRLEKGFIQLDLVFNYAVKVYRKCSVNVGEDSLKGTPVMAKMEVASRTFSVLKEAVLIPKRKNYKTEKIKMDILSTNITQKQGWFRLEAQLEITISYIGMSKKVYEETSQYHISECYTWEGLSDRMLLDYQPVLEYENYIVEGTRVVYRFLLNFVTVAYQNREFQLKTITNEQSAYQFYRENRFKERLLSTRSDPQLGKVSFTLEKEIPVKLGIPRDIVTNHSFISGFEYRDAFKALLIQGEFETDLEYCDTEGYLRNEQLFFPFWKFVSGDIPERGLGLGLIPEIKNLSFTPVQGWPWQKGVVKIKVDLELRKAE